MTAMVQSMTALLSGHLNLWMSVRTATRHSLPKSRSPGAGSVPLAYLPSRVLVGSALRKDVQSRYRVFLGIVGVSYTRARRLNRRGAARYIRRPPPRERIA